MKLDVSLKGNLKAAKRGDTDHDVLSALRPPEAVVKGRYMSLDPAIFTRRVFKDVLSSVLLREEEGREGPLPGEDTKHILDIGLAILHFSKHRSCCR